MRVPSTEVQNNFGKYLKFVEVNEEIIVTKNGRDIARILPCDDPHKNLVAEEAAEYQTRGGRVTYEEFMELVESSDQRFELIDGVIYNLASPSYGHQYAVREIIGTFYIWFKNKKCIPLTSPFDVTFLRRKITSVWFSRISSLSVTRITWTKKGSTKEFPPWWLKFSPCPPEARILLKSWSFTGNAVSRSTGWLIRKIS